MSHPPTWYDEVCWTIRSAIYNIALEIDMARVHDRRMDPPLEDQLR
jgi:hypothetical protein